MLFKHTRNHFNFGSDDAGDSGTSSDDQVEEITDAPAATLEEESSDQAVDSTQKETDQNSSDMSDDDNEDETSDSLEPTSADSDESDVPTTAEDISSDQAVDSTQEETNQNSSDMSSGDSQDQSSASTQPALSASAIDRIFQYLADSGLVEHSWKDRGKAPIGYLKGIALTYARVYCKYTAPERMPGGPSSENETFRDRFAVKMAKGIAPGANVATDAIVRYADKLKELGANVSVDGVDVLRSLFTILIGLGIRESSGKYCTGWDLGKLNGWGNPTKAVKPSATNSEAGLFQISYDIGVGVPGDFHDLYETYKQRSGSGFLDVFSEGVTCSTHDAENFGEGVGKDFQQFSKECPAFTAELAALGLRTRANHWGPINKNTVEILQECYLLLKGVEAAMDDLDGCSAVL